MFHTKSFNLTGEEEANRKAETLYQPRRCRWMKYIVVPALLGFMLLLVLSNVNFSTSKSTETTTESTASITETLGTTVDLIKYRKVDRPNDCVDYGDRCHTRCSGNLLFVDNELEDQQGWCGSGRLNVEFVDCDFPLGRWDKTLLRGYFQIEILTIRNCNLEIIQEDVFIQAPLKTLKTLNITEVKLTELSRSTFVGLEKLEKLIIINNPQNFSFNSSEFLQPLVSLNELHLSFFAADVVDPKIWFGERNFDQLEFVHFSHNNFGEKLNASSFLALKKVQRLDLSQCSITSIDLIVFENLADTLQYLDLSNNKLTTLHGGLQWLIQANFYLELQNNPWDCSCDDQKMVRFVQNENFMHGPIECVTPAKWKGYDMAAVEFDCSDVITTTTQVSTEETTHRTTEKIIKDTTGISASMTDDDDTTGTTTALTESTTKSSAVDSTTETTTVVGESTPTTVEMVLLSSTTPSASELITIKCQHSTNGDQDVTINNCNAKFTIESASPSSVNVHIYTDDSSPPLSLIYYKATPKGEQRAKMIGINRRLSKDFTTQPPTSVLHLPDLDHGETYIFCLMPFNSDMTSPFNCRSHYIPRSRLKVWLLHGDKTWFGSVIAVGVVLSMAVGGLSMYWLLRWRPTFVKGNKRLKRLNRYKRKVLLLPKKKSYERSYGVRDRYSSVDHNPNISAYSMAYQDIGSGQYTFSNFYAENLPPTVRAPNPPSRHSSRSGSTLSTIPIEDLCEEEYDDDEHIYQRIDFYESFY